MPCLSLNARSKVTALEPQPVNPETYDKVIAGVGSGNLMVNRSVPRRDQKSAWLPSLDYELEQSVSYRLRVDWLPKGTARVST